jgi:hypothetical protein
MTETKIKENGKEGDREGKKNIRNVEIISLKQNHS